MTKYNKYQNARKLVLFKVRKLKKNYQNYFQKHLKNVNKNYGTASQSIVTLKSKDETAPISLIVNGNVITNKNYINDIFNDCFD